MAIKTLTKHEYHVVKCGTVLLNDESITNSFSQYDGLFMACHVGCCELRDEP